MGGIPADSNAGKVNIHQMEDGYEVIFTLSNRSKSHKPEWMCNYLIQTKCV